MNIPGQDVVLVDAPAPRGAPTATDALFLLDFTGEGPSDAPQLILAPDQADTTFGNPVAWGSLQACLDTFFAVGGARAYVQRVLGPAAAKATVAIPGAVGNSLIATALYEGVYGNGGNGGFTVDVIQGAGGAGTRVLIVKRGGIEAGRSAEATTRDGLVVTVAGVAFTAGDDAGLPTVAAGLSLAGGTDDHNNATTATWQAARDKFGVGLGPGQLVAPAAQTDTLHALLIAHGWDRNRFVLPVPPPGATDAELTTLAEASIDEQGSRFGALWRDWVTVPSRVYGASSRTVPWSVVQAGLIARTDLATRNPNREAAGIKNGYGIAEYVESIIDEVDDTRRQALRNAQVNTAKSVYGQAVAYGMRTLADLTTLPQWWNIGGSRTIMAARALLADVDEQEAFGQLDGQGQWKPLYAGAIRGALKPLYDVGALYGATYAEACRVDTGDSVNTPDTIKAGEKRARTTLKTSPGAEHVVTFLSRVAIDQPV